MSLITRMKKQTCVHWPRTGVDNRGRSEYDTPVELDCRWADKTEKFMDVQGEERISNAVVYVAGVNVGDVLYLGTLTDSGLDSNDPLKNDGAWKVERVDAIPNLKATETLYKVYL